MWRQTSNWCVCAIGDRCNSGLQDDAYFYAILKCDHIITITVKTDRNSQWSHWPFQTKTLHAENLVLSVFGLHVQILFQILNFWDPLKNVRPKSGPVSCLQPQAMGTLSLFEPLAFSMWVMLQPCNPKRSHTHCRGGSSKASLWDCGRPQRRKQRSGWQLETESF